MISRKVGCNDYSLSPSIFYSYSKESAIFLSSVGRYTEFNKSNAYFKQQLYSLLYWAKLAYQVMLTICGRLTTPFILGFMSVGLNILICHSFTDL